MNFLKIFSDSFIDNWNKPAVTSYSTGLKLDYGALAARIDCTRLLLERLQVEKGTHIAVIGRNSIDWITNYLGILISGCVPVSYQMTYDTTDMIGALAAADVEIIFIDEFLMENLENLRDFDTIKLIISQNEFKALYTCTNKYGDVEQIIGTMDMYFANKYPEGFQPSDVTGYYSSPESPAAIFFTSGTLGYPKPVLLSHDNIEGIIVFGLKSNLFPRDSNTLTSSSVGNVWGTLFNFLIPLASGSNIVVFNGIYNAESLIKALRRVKPRRLILSPRQLHDIYNRLEEQQRRSHLFKYVSYAPFGNAIARFFLRRRFNKAMGGSCIEVIIGSTNLERHLREKLDRAKIKYTASYGLTECSGLVSYTPANEFEPHTVGRAIRSFIKCRVRPIEIPGFPENAGELEVHGMLVMKGYYNDEGANQEAFTRDGWFKTGELASINSDGNIRIHGRKDTMIQYGKDIIVPERLEATINEMPSIKQSIVVDRDGTLAVIVYPDTEAIGDKEVTAAVNNDIQRVNDNTPHFIHIDIVDIVDHPLEMTLKGTVARFKYF
ncbi:MAG: AMP-binding protein [Clostridiales bacterium]|nr:AMP-binding protein [Clostridiales bacterium]